MSDDQYQRFSDRFFEVSPLYTRSGWYIRLRGGKVIGPFICKAAARVALFNLFGVIHSEAQPDVKTAPLITPYSANTRR